jgi:hypothetical protein
MSPKVETFIDRHAPGIIVGLCTVLGWVFVLGMVYTSIERRLQDCEKSGSEMRISFARHIEAQVSLEKENAVRLARIESGVDFIKESIQQRHPNATRTQVTSSSSDLLYRGACSP